MSRDIIFRGKGIKDDVWFYGGYTTDWNAEGEDNFYIVDTPYLIPVKKETVGQFTGIYDIDGERIWEGMTVNQKSVSPGDEDVDFTGTVTFEEGCWLIQSLNDSVILFSEDRENRIIE